MFMPSKACRFSECPCLFRYDGDWFSASNLEGRVCETHSGLGLSIHDVHAIYVTLFSERTKINTEISKLAESNPDMKEVCIDTNLGTLRLAEVADANAYLEKDHPRKEVLKAEYNPITTLKEDGSFEVKLPETDKKAELEAALLK